MINTGAGTGKDISAPINDLGLNNGTALTAQEVRDAMKLAPAGGAPAAGSVDEHLDDVLADTTDIKATTLDTQANTVIIGNDTTTIINNVATVDGNVDDIKTAVAGTFDELAVGESPKNPTLKQLLMRLYMKVRNKETATRSDASNGSEQVFNDAGTPILKKVYSDAGGTTTVNKEVDPS